MEPQRNEERKDVAKKNFAFFALLAVLRGGWVVTLYRPPTRHARRVPHKTICFSQRRLWGSLDLSRLMDT